MLWELAELQSRSTQNQWRHAQLWQWGFVCLNSKALRKPSEHRCQNVGQMGLHKLLHFCPSPGGGLSCPGWTLLLGVRGAIAPSKKLKWERATPNVLLQGKAPSPNISPMCTYSYLTPLKESDQPGQTQEAKDWRQRQWWGLEAPRPWPYHGAQHIHRRGWPQHVPQATQHLAMIQAIQRQPCRQPERSEEFFAPSGPFCLQHICRGSSRLSLHQVPPAPTSLFIASDQSQSRCL